MTSKIPISLRSARILGRTFMLLESDPQRLTFEATTAPLSTARVISRNGITAFLDPWELRRW